MRLTGNMHRGHPGRLLVPAVIAASLVVPAPVPAAALEGTEERTPITVSPFYPEGRDNISDCVGLLQRPGCGSDARGGWRQTAIFGALAAGIAVIVGRVIIGVRRNREPDQPDG